MNNSEKGNFWTWL